MKKLSTYVCCNDLTFRRDSMLSFSLPYGLKEKEGDVRPLWGMTIWLTEGRKYYLEFENKELADLAWQRLAWEIEAEPTQLGPLNLNNCNTLYTPYPARERPSIPPPPEPPKARKLKFW